jgi:hypothetical protein
MQERESNRRDEDVELQAATQRFKQWRQIRARGDRIPPELWAEAVELARRYGPRCVVRLLEVDKESLNKRLASEAGSKILDNASRALQAGDDGMAFVECRAVGAAPGVPECVMELRNAHGAVMRLELSGSAVASLNQLCNAFWSAP